MNAATTEIEIFRPGRHIAMSGETLSFAAADLSATAAAYDPARHEAPLCIGHPKLDAPAYGWVQALSVNAGRLVATAGQVDPAFAAAVRKGAFRHVSAAFFRPDAPDNPSPGVWSLRHVGFLGAAVPAVTGLRPASFAAATEPVVFAALEDSVSPIPAPIPAPAPVPDPAPAPTPAPDPAELARREAELAARMAAFAAREAEQRGRDIAAFLDAHMDRIGGGERRDRVAAFMAALDGTTSVAFAAGGSATMLDRFREIVAALPKVVELGERAADASFAAARGAAGAAVFAAPAGYEVDPDRLALLAKAKAWMASHPGSDLPAALRAVGGT